MATGHEREADRLRVLALRGREDDDLIGRPVEQLGLVLPELHCGNCTNRIISLICWDDERGCLSCIRCSATLHRLDPETDRFYTLSIEARGQIPGVGFLPLGQAREILTRFGAREP